MSLNFSNRTERQTSSSYTQLQRMALAKPPSQTGRAETKRILTTVGNQKICNGIIAVSSWSNFEWQCLWFTIHFNRGPPALHNSKVRLRKLDQTVKSNQLSRRERRDSMHPDDVFDFRSFLITFITSTKLHNHHIHLRRRGFVH